VKSHSICDIYTTWREKADQTSKDAKEPIWWNHKTFVI
jgi:hypothetical protein